MKCENIKLMTFTNLVLMVFLIFNFVSALELPGEDGQVYVCPLAKNLEEINPKCECRIDLILGETVKSVCGTTTYEITLTIQEYEDQQYYAIYGFENGGAGVNFKPVAKISGKLEGFVGENLNFSGTNSFDRNGDSLYFYWNFGDERYDQGENVTHAYNLPGNYLLTLEIGDGLASSTATTTITIKERFISSSEVVIPFPIKEKEIEEKNDVEEITKKEIKFLAPANLEISFKIPIEEKIEDKEKTEVKETFPKIQKENKIHFQKENFLASLIEIIKWKISIYLVIFVSLSIVIFGISKIIFKKKKRF